MPQLRGQRTRRPTGATHCASVHTEGRKKKKRRETAGAGHQRSLQMTSPDKCWSDLQHSTHTHTHTHTFFSASLPGPLTKYL